MAVQIPRLERFAPVQPTSSGQIDAQPLNVTQGIAQTSNQISGLMGAAADQMARAENQQADLTATRLSLQYEEMYQGELDNIRGMKGDPTLAYTQFDEKMSKEFEKLGETYKDAIGPVRNIVEQKLQSTAGRLRMKREVTEGSQFRAYRRETYNAEVGQIANQRVLDAIELDTLDPEAKKEGKFVNLELAIQDIMTARDKQGIAEGLMVSGPNGQERSAVLNSMINEDVSTAIGNVVQALNLSGDNEAAEKVIDKYKDRLLAKTRIDLMKKTQDAGIDKKAFAIEHELRFLPPSKAMAEVEKKTKDPEVINKVRKLVDERARINTLNKERESDAAYQEIYSFVQATASANAKAAQEGKVTGIASPSRTWLEQSDVWGAMADRLNAKDKEALYSMVSKPKESDEAARLRMMEYATNDGFLGMSAQEFEKEARGLNQAEYKTYRSTWQRLNSDTEGEARGRIKFMSDNLSHLLFTAKILKKKDRRYWSRKDAATFAEYSGEMMDYLDKAPPKQTPMEQMKWLREFVEDKRNEVPFRRAFNGGTETSKAIQQAQKDPRTRAKWSAEFARTKNAAPKNSAELDDYIRQRNGKLSD